MNRRSKFFMTSVVAAVFCGLSIVPTHSASISGSKCPSAGATLTVSTSKYICAKSGKNYIWQVVRSSKSDSTGNKGIPTPKPSSKYIFNVTADQKVSQTKFGNCTALLPSGYTTMTDAAGDVGEFWSPDKKFYGSWYIRPVNTSEAWAQSDRIYGIDPLIDSADPETQIIASAKYVAKTLNYDPNYARYGDPITSNGYVGIEARSSDSRAILIYKSPVIPGDGISYNYMAIGRVVIGPISATDKEIELNARNALSITCSPKYSQPTSGSSFSSSSHSTAKKGIGPAPTDQEENATLGTTYATDSLTGDLYNLSLRDWSADPCGTGSSGWGVPSGNGCKVVGH